MKKLLIIVLIIVMVLSLGCFAVPEDPEPDPLPVEGIVCEEGHYVVYWNEWTATLCDDAVVNSAGTYWENVDGRLFLLGDPVDIELVFAKYGVCPTEYVEEIIY